MPGAMDVVIETTRTATGAKVSFDKQKDDEELEPYHVLTQRVDIGGGRSSLILEKSTVAAELLNANLAQDANPELVEFIMRFPESESGALTLTEIEEMTGLARTSAERTVKKAERATGPKLKKITGDGSKHNPTRWFRV